jgi:lipopolysaccharide transport system permease protein
MALSLIRPLWAYRGFIIASVNREYQSKYRNSLLGAVWTLINPLAMIIVYTVIFSQIMKAKLPGVDTTFAYSIYLCAGVLTWGLFAEIVGRAQNTFLENANLLKKLSFPRLCLPVIVVANAGLNFAIILLPVLAILVAFAIGLGITLGVLNVFFRDVGQFFGIFLQFWFWLTPIVYPVSILPERLQPYMNLNPMARLIDAFQVMLVTGQWPNWYGLWPVVVLSIILCVIGFGLFRRHAGEMVDEL